MIGSPEIFSLEARIFHSICLGLMALTAIYAPYNTLEGLYVGGISAVVLAVFFFLQYYNSRFRGRPHSTVIFALAGIVVFSVNYFANSGINGSTDLIWPAYLLMVLVISPYRQHFFWVGVYLLAFLVIHIVEYKYPELVKHPFDLGKGQFIDRVTAFPLPVVGIAMIIIFIRRSYDREKAATDEKAATIELRNEQILQQKNELEKSNAEKNKLLSIVSHDMRAPFNNIQGYLQLLTENNLDADERQMVEGELLRATEQTMEMLSNLLYWSRSQMDGYMVSLTGMSLLTTLEKTIEIEKMIAAKKNITLSYQLHAGINVMADANMLQLVVRNVISNAIKFTHEGGTINIHTRVMSNECEISIADNGVGIDPSKKDTLFAMTSRSTFGTNNEKGVGLGLPLCKDFMEQQNGRITVESEPGKGSCFYVSIPLA